MTFTNKDIAQFLEEIATMMRLAGENDFRSAAFDRAARTIENLDEPLQSYLETHALTSIKGIGASIAKDIEAFAETGTAPVLESLKQKVPKELTEWLSISGLGPKKIHKIHTAFGITTISELKEKCEDGSVASLSGMGKKSAEKILKSITWLEQFSERCRLDEAHTIAQRFLNTLKALPGVDRIEIAGSLRRKKETIGDIDFLIAASEENRESIFDAFTQSEEVVEVLGRGDTKSSVRVTEGRQVDLRIVDAGAFEAALMYFTGSKEHNVVMRQRARERSLSLNEYGLFQLDASGNTDFDQPITDARSEHEIYQRLGVNFVPPELREDRGEFAWFEKKSSVELVSREDIKGVLHAHSTYSDGKFSLKEMAQACIERGYQYLGITDHSQTAAYAGGLSVEKVYQQWKEIDSLNDFYASEKIDFQILKGIESDILSDGSLDYDADILSGFDFIIASVHFSLDMKPQAMLDRFRAAVENPYSSIIGHPTGRLLLKREGNPFDINRLIEIAVEHDTAIEINASPWRLDLDWRYGRKAKEMGLCSAICPDAHSIEGIDDIQYGVSIARKAWFESDRIINSWSTEKVLEWFKKKR